MRDWLDSNEMADLDVQERRGAMFMADHEAEITRWHNDLPEAARPRANHPNTILRHHRPKSVPTRRGPKKPNELQEALRQERARADRLERELAACPREVETARRAPVATDGQPQVHGLNVYMPGEHIRRASLALRKHWQSGDTILLAKLALEAAFRTDRAVVSASTSLVNPQQLTC